MSIELRYYGNDRRRQSDRLKLLEFIPLKRQLQMKRQANLIANVRLFDLGSGIKNAIGLTQKLDPNGMQCSKCVPLLYSCAQSRTGYQASIGSVIDVRVEGGSLRGDLQFSEGDPVASAIKKYWSHKALSVEPQIKILVKEGIRAVRWQLLGLRALILP